MEIPWSAASCDEMLMRGRATPMHLFVVGSMATAATDRASWGSSIHIIREEGSVDDVMMRDHHKRHRRRSHLSSASWSASCLTLFLYMLVMLGKPIGTNAGSSCIKTIGGRYRVDM